MSPLPVHAATGSATATPAPLRSAAVPASPSAAPAVPPRGRDQAPAAPETATVPSAGTSPSDSCLGSVRYDLDLSATELGVVRSMCFRVGAVLRLQGTGPGLVTAEPESLVTQDYAAGVEDIRFVRSGTVVVTIPRETETYTITVVVVE